MARKSGSRRRSPRLPRRRRRSSAARWVLLLLSVAAAVAIWWDRWPVPKRIKSVPRTAQVPPGPPIDPGQAESGFPVAAASEEPARLQETMVDPVPPSPRSGTHAPSPPPAVPSVPLGGEDGTQQTYPRPARTVLEAQVALARQGISPGSIDGVWGQSTRIAVLAFQEREGLPRTGELDESTRTRLLLEKPALATYVVAPEDFVGLQPLAPTWTGKAQQAALEHETLLERLAERSKASPRLLQRLNPEVDWDRVNVGATIRVPEAPYPVPTAPAARLAIRLSEKWVRVFDGQGRLLAHFPCSIAAKAEKRPAGRLEIVSVAENPNYTFDPVMFPESEEGRALGRKLVLPPGPNNPVGSAWIGLSLPGYGIHGTPYPERIGRTESHGCFRLTNWDAEYLLRLVRVGMPVEVEP